MSKTTNGNKPLDRIKVGRVEATVWANSNDDGSIRHSVTLSRSYKADGEWRSTGSSSPGERWPR